MTNVATIASTIGEASKNVAKVAIDNLPKVATVMNIAVAVLTVAESINNLAKNNVKPVQVEADIQETEVTEEPVVE